MTTNTISELEAEVISQNNEKSAIAKVRLARVRLLLGRDGTNAFFATLSLRLEVVCDRRFPTAATDGCKLYINPEYVLSLNLDQVVGLVCHEVMHPALGHHARKEHRDHEKWNIAADLAENHLIREAEYTLPDGALFAGQEPFADFPVGLSMEAYYPMITDDHMKAMEGSPCPGKCGVGEVLPAPGQNPNQSKLDWEIAVAEAHTVAKRMQGTLPGGIDRLVKGILEPEVNWKDVLREFITRMAKNDYSWSNPNRRYVHLGLYMPSLRSEELGDLVLAIDTSGSIGQQELQRFASEVQGMVEAHSVSLTIIYHDSRVAGVQTWDPSEGDIVALDAKGGGGTDHRPVFDYIEEQHLEPSCLVCFTDLYSSFPDAPPEYPTLWCVVDNEGQGPFGTTLKVKV